MEPKPKGPDDSAFHEQFAQLRRHFVEGLARREHEIDASADLVALHAVLHRLAGAAGAFGYEELGECARRVMHCVRAGDAAAVALQVAQLKSVMHTISQS